MRLEVERGAWPESAVEAVAPRPRPGDGEPAVPASLRAQLSDYYRVPAVRARILEFLGATAEGEPAARFVTTAPAALYRPFSPSPAAALWAALDRDLELARSLWDRDGLLAHLDIEHVHFDRPWETYAFQARAFALQQPVAAVVAALLEGAGIVPLHVLTGRGHHWAWRIPRDSQACSALAALAPPALRQCAAYRTPQPPAGEVVGEEMGAAYHGLGLVLEGLAHEVLRAVEAASEVPVQLTAVAVGPGPRGREIVSIDLSPFGDPLPARTARVPFTVYLKGWRMGRRLAPPLALPPLVTVTMPTGMPLAAVLVKRRLEGAAAFATRTTAAVPDGSAGTLRLVAAYLASPVAAFHRWYYGCEPEPPDRWSRSYDRLDLTTLPPCVGRVLAQPNDRILRPAELQHLVRVLLAMGWHPRHIAGLVRSKLERDYGWQRGLHFFDAEVRADFYVRLFAGLALVGTDGLIDFNCVSAREKDLCPGVSCGWNLGALRDELLVEKPRWPTGP